jgi:hypothetical protein
VLVREDLTYRFSGNFTGAFRDIPLTRGVQARDVHVSEGGRLPQGLRIVWHYRQDGGPR